VQCRVKLDEGLFLAYFDTYFSELSIICMHRIPGMTAVSGRC
jgi:hypothetical protein